MSGCPAVVTSKWVPLVCAPALTGSQNPMRLLHVCSCCCQGSTMKRCFGVSLGRPRLPRDRRRRPPEPAATVSPVALYNLQGTHRLCKRTCGAPFIVWAAICHSVISKLRFYVCKHSSSLPAIIETTLTSLQFVSRRRLIAPRPNKPVYATTPAPPCPRNQRFEKKNEIRMRQDWR